MVTPGLFLAINTAVSGLLAIARLAWIPRAAPQRPISAAIWCGVPINRPSPAMEKTTVPGEVRSTVGEKEDASAKRSPWGA